MNPYAAPASELGDAPGDRAALSRAGRVLLWLAFAGNALLAGYSIYLAMRLISLDLRYLWPGALRISLAALSISALFRRNSAALFWLAAIVNALFAAAVALNVVLLISHRGRMAPEAAAMAETAIMGAVPVGLLCLLTMLTLVMNRGKS